MQSVACWLETAPLRLHRRWTSRAAVRAAAQRIINCRFYSRISQRDDALPISEGLPNLVGRFQHQPLSSNTCTRILTIQPSSDKTTPINLTVEEIDLAAPHEPFVAISHVWGSDPLHDRLTFCNGKTHRVTGRVDSILHRIRAKIVEDEQCRHWQRVWIDTLCIDQAENTLALEEKSHQVSIMHQIFGNAKEVIIDLGRADRYSHLLPTATSDIELLREKAFDDEYCKFILGFPSAAKVNEESSKRVRRSLEACSRLLDKQWFSRIWAIQEFALAQKASFLLGNIRVDGHLLQVLGALASDTNLKGRSHLSMLFSRFRRALALTKLPRLSSIRNKGNIDVSKKLKFGESLGLGWHHDFTDERDVVYALRALVDYCGSPLKVDYNEPSDSLSRRVSMKLIELGDYEAMLAGAQGLLNGSMMSQTTWSFRLRVPFKSIGEERQWIISGKPTRYRAGGSSTSPPTLNRSTDQADFIEALVTIVGEVKAVTEKFPNIPRYGLNPKLPVEKLFSYNTERTIHTRAVIMNAWLRHILPVINEAREHSLLDRRSDELWRAITHGHNAMEFQSHAARAQERVNHFSTLADMALKSLEILGYRPQAGISLFEDMRMLEAAMKQRLALLNEAAQKPRAWLDEVYEDLDVAENRSAEEHAPTSNGSLVVTNSHETRLKRVLVNAYLVNQAFDIRKVRPPDQLKMIGRRVCVLEDGRLATAPHTAEVGDVIAVFKGISVPYVLRRNRENYWLVGMAYVDDIMRGEAISEDTQWERINLI